MLAAAEKVTGKTIPRSYGARREGDPPALVADSKRARSELGWTPRFHELETIIAHAWAWERRVAGCATPFSG